MAGYPERKPTISRVQDRSDTRNKNYIPEAVLRGERQPMNSRELQAVQAQMLRRMEEIYLEENRQDAHTYESDLLHARTNEEFEAARRNGMTRRNERKAAQVQKRQRMKAAMEGELLKMQMEEQEQEQELELDAPPPMPVNIVVGQPPPPPDKYWQIPRYPILIAGFPGVGKTHFVEQQRNPALTQYTSFRFKECDIRKYQFLRSRPGEPAIPDPDFPRNYILEIDRLSRVPRCDGRRNVILFTTSLEINEGLRYLQYHVVYPEPDIKAEYVERWNTAVQDGEGKVYDADMPLPMTSREADFLTNDFDAVLRAYEKMSARGRSLREGEYLADVMPEILWGMKRVRKPRGRRPAPANDTRGGEGFFIFVAIGVAVWAFYHFRG